MGIPEKVKAAKSRKLFSLSLDKNERFYCRPTYNCVNKKVHGH